MCLISYQILNQYKQRTHYVFIINIKPTSSLKVFGFVPQVFVTELTFYSNKNNSSFSFVLDCACCIPLTSKTFYIVLAYDGLLNTEHTEFVHIRNKQVYG